MDLAARMPSLRNVVGLWRTPEQVGSSACWSAQQATLTDVYLFGALAEGAGFVRDDTAIAGWIQRRDLIFDEIKMVDFRERDSSMTTRVMAYTP